MSYQIKLETFEGPLDLLLHLIEKEEMDIYDIQIAKITDQYLQYIHTIQQLKLDVTCEFLVMAATLLSIKSKMLLPNHNDELDIGMDYEEDDPREELIQRLIEYKKYKELSKSLREMEIDRSKIYTRSASSLASYLILEEENPVDGISLYHLVDAFERALTKYSYRDPLTTIEREEITVKDRISQIISLLKNHNGIIYFSDLFIRGSSKSDIVVTFLSILELMKQKTILCVQNQTFDEIVIHYTPNEGDEKHGLQ